MAQWDRDPKLRVRLAWLLAAVEAAALTMNFHFVFAAYFNQVVLRFGGTLSYGVGITILIAATILCLVGAAFVGVAYVRGRPWARSVLIGGNVVLVVLGVAWFLKNRIAGTAPDPFAARAGLALPLATLFPLLWPLIVFRPAGSEAAER